MSDCTAVLLWCSRFSLNIKGDNHKECLIISLSRKTSQTSRALILKNICSIKRILFLIVLNLWSTSWAQHRNREIDSLFQHATYVEIESPLKAQTEVKKALTLSKRRHYKRGIIRAEIFLSESYTRAKNHQKALFYATSVEKRIANYDYTAKAKALRLKGISLGRLGFAEDGRKFLKQATNYIDKIVSEDEKNENLGYIYANWAENYYENNLYKDSIGYYYHKSFNCFYKIDNTSAIKKKSMAFAEVNLGTFYLQELQLDKATRYFEKALSLSQNESLDFISIEALSGLGTVHYYAKDYQHANSNFSEALAIAQSKNRIYYIHDLYDNLSRTFKKLNQTDSSNYYRERYINLNERLIKANKVGIDQSLNFYLDEKDKATNQNLKVILVSITIIAVLILICLLYMRLYRKRLRKLQLESKSISEQLQRKQEMIQNLLRQQKSSESEIDELMQFAMSSNPGFFTKFKEIHPDFISKITAIAPNMLLSELRFCALIKLGFTAPEIATYTKSTIRSVESRRYRLRKKMNLPSDIDLRDWLINL